MAVPSWAVQGPNAGLQALQAALGNLSLAPNDLAPDPMNTHATPHAFRSAAARHAAKTFAPALPPVVEVVKSVAAAPLRAAPQVEIGPVEADGNQVERRSFSASLLPEPPERRPSVSLSSAPSESRVSDSHAAEEATERARSRSITLIAPQPDADPHPAPIAPQIVLNPRVVTPIMGPRPVSAATTAIMNCIVGNTPDSPGISPPSSPKEERSLAAPVAVPVPVAQSVRVPLPSATPPGPGAAVLLEELRAHLPPPVSPPQLSDSVVEVVRRCFYTVFRDDNGRYYDRDYQTDGSENPVSHCYDFDNDRRGEQRRISKKEMEGLDKACSAMPGVHAIRSEDHRSIALSVVHGKDEYTWNNKKVDVCTCHWALDGSIRPQCEFAERAQRIAELIADSPYFFELVLKRGDDVTNFHVLHACSRLVDKIGERLWSVYIDNCCTYSNMTVYAVGDFLRNADEHGYNFSATYPTLRDRRVYMLRQ